MRPPPGRDPAHKINGYYAMWSAKGEDAVHTVVDTARKTSGAGTFSTVRGTIGA